MTNAEVLKRLRAWIYLRAPVTDWLPFGVSEKDVLRVGVDRELLVLVAMATVFHYARGGKEEAEREFSRLIQELVDIGLNEGELRTACEALFAAMKQFPDRTS